LAQDRRHKIKKARERLVLCRLMIDIMRTVHGAYAPVIEPFGTRLETFFIALCVALGDIDGKPFSVAKIAAYMRMPRTTVIRRLERLRGNAKAYFEFDAHDRPSGWNGWLTLSFSPSAPVSPRSAMLTK
jgi:hypothetical protein